MAGTCSPTPGVQRGEGRRRLWEGASLSPPKYGVLAGELIYVRAQDVPGSTETGPPQTMPHAPRHPAVHLRPLNIQGHKSVKISVSLSSVIANCQPEEGAWVPRVCSWLVRSAGDEDWDAGSEVGASCGTEPLAGGPGTRPKQCRN